MEAYVVKKLVFVTNNFVEDVIGNFPGPVQNFSKQTATPKYVISLLKLVFRIN